MRSPHPSALGALAQRAGSSRLRGAAGALGVAGLCAAAWIGIGMLWPPLDATWVKLAAMTVIVALALVVVALRRVARRRRAAAMEEEIVLAAAGDAADLARRMTEVLGRLKVLGGRSGLPDLPWYVIIGPPGAGKTTALRNSGLAFAGDEAAPVEGFGGTRNCEWWFAEEAVLLDTAGRYTTQDSEASRDAAGWLAFLDLLKRHRPRQPINGVILALSCEDMMEAAPEGAAAPGVARHAELVRARLAELHERLRVDVPVYVLFSKADLVAGFREYFDDLPPARRRAVWGVTFPTRDRSEPTWKAAPQEFGALVARLSDELVDRLAEEADARARIALFALPGQMALLRPNVTEFLRLVFQPTRYASSAILRGFYFASGTQEGSPIDQVLGAMARNSDEPGAAALRPTGMSGRGRSYFLHDLLARVIFAERDWVGFDARAARKSTLLRAGALGAIAAATLAAMGWLGFSFWWNREAVRGSGSVASTLAAGLEEVSKLQGTSEGEVAILDPQEVLTHIDALRSLSGDCEGLIPSEGADIAAVPTPDRTWFPGGLELGGTRGVQGAACDTYLFALESLLRPRVVARLAEDVRARIDDQDVEGLFLALKAYLILGLHPASRDAAPDEMERGAAGDRVRALWDDAYELDDQVAARLGLHLASMMANREAEAPEGPDQQPLVDESLVRDAQADLGELSPDERAFAQIEAAAGAALEPASLTFLDLAGERGAEVFEVAGAGSPEGLAIPRLFTHDGYWYFQGQLGGVADRLARDRWVLGEEAVDEYDLGTLRDDLRQRYGEEFQDTWDGILGSLALRPMTEPAVIEVLADAEGPLQRLVERVADETDILRLFDRLAALLPKDQDACATWRAGGDLDLDDVEFLFAQSAAVREVVEAYGATDCKSTVGEQGDSHEDAEEMMGLIGSIGGGRRSDWEDLVADGGRNLDVIRGHLLLLAEEMRDGAPDDVGLTIRAIETSAIQAPAISDWLGEIEEDASSQIAADSVQDVEEAFSDVVASCREAIEGRFPLGDGPPVAVDEFEDFFGPEGAMTAFMRRYVRGGLTEVDGELTQPDIVLTPDGDPIQAPPVAQGALLTMQSAEAINQEFYDDDDLKVTFRVSLRDASYGDPEMGDLGTLSLRGADGRESVKRDADVEFVWDDSAGQVRAVLFTTPAGDPLAFPQGEGDLGVWSIVSALESGGREGGTVNLPLDNGQGRATMRFVFDGRVPFLMSELRGFRCPDRLFE